MMDVARIYSGIPKMESVIKKIPGSDYIRAPFKGTTAFFKHAGKNFEVRYANEVGLVERVIKNADGDVLSITKKIPYKTPDANGFATITKDAEGNVLRWVADFSSDRTRYIMNDKSYPGGYQFPRP